MTPLFQFSLAVSIPLAILSVIYRIWFASEKRLEANRIFIICIYLISIGLYPVVTYVITSLIASGQIIYVHSITPNFIRLHIQMTVIIWLTGTIICTIFTFIELLRIIHTIKGCTKKCIDGHIIYISENNEIKPFSFGNIIVVGKTDYDDNKSLNMIVAHEMGHLTHRHSIDMILAQSITILCWYNPAAWILRRELKCIHEFQADDFVLCTGFDIRSYQIFLLKRATNSQFPTMAHNLGYHNMRRRISMMNHSIKSVQHNKLRYIAPLIGILSATYIFSIPAVWNILSIPHMSVIRINSDYSDSDVKSTNQFDMDVYIDGTFTQYENLNDIPSSEISAITVNKTKKQIYVELKK